MPWFGVPVTNPVGYFCWVWCWWSQPSLSAWSGDRTCCPWNIHNGLCKALCHLLIENIFSGNVWFKLLCKNILYWLCVCVMLFGVIFLLPFKFSSFLPDFILALGQVCCQIGNGKLMQILCPVPMVWTKLSSLLLLLLMPSFISSSPFPCRTDSWIGNQLQLCSSGVLPEVLTIN